MGLASTVGSSIVDASQLRHGTPAREGERTDSQAHCGGEHPGIVAKAHEQQGGRDGREQREKQLGTRGGAAGWPSTYHAGFVGRQPISVED